MVAVLPGMRNGAHSGFPYVREACSQDTPVAWASRTVRRDGYFGQELSGCQIEARALVISIVSILLSIQANLEGPDPIAVELYTMVSIRLSQVSVDAA